ncbi:MAG: hypothetical protein K0Q55_3163 [Verrucomicrobia bacterium]|jgi:hypothetical protein|nr:hypothetical protein [Verrucomicrobiota bacterium]
MGKPKNTRDWSNKGCEKCRVAWETHQQLDEVAVSRARKALLYRCRYCDTYWEQGRHLDTLSVEEVALHYPKVVG